MPPRYLTITLAWKIDPGSKKPTQRVSTGEISGYPNRNYAYSPHLPYRDFDQGGKASKGNPLSGIR